MTRPSGSSRSQLRNWLFDEVDQVVATIFRVLLSLLLVLAFWPRGLVPDPNYIDLPVMAGLWPWFLGMPCRLLMAVLLILFALGWSRCWAGLVLAGLLVPHAFLDEGNQSRQVMIFVLACTSLLPAASLFLGTRRRHRPMPIWPLRLIQVQLTVLYGVNALYKATPEFLGGEVMVGLSTMDSFHLDLSSGALELGFVSIPAWILGTGAVLTESWLAIGFWIPRLRVATAVLGVCFHLMLVFVMTIFMLDVVSCFLYLAFLLPMKAGGSRP